MQTTVSFCLDAPKNELRAVRDLLDAVIGETRQTEFQLRQMEAHMPVVKPGLAAEIPQPPEEPDDAPVPYAPGEVDSQGVLWDERIHSSSHAKNKDGTWRARRGLKDVAPPVATAPPDIPAPPAVPDAAPPPVAAPMMPVGEVISRITAAMASGKITQADLVAACHARGLPNGLLGLGADPSKGPGLLESLNV
jgi:hypothetical protein